MSRALWPGGGGRGRQPGQLYSVGVVQMDAWGVQSNRVRKEGKQNSENKIIGV